MLYKHKVLENDVDIDVAMDEKAQTANVLVQNDEAKK